MSIIACVPNISEGRDKKIINAIVSAAQNAADIKILGVESGYDINRTIITFAGAPSAAQAAAFACIKKSYELIDMSAHKGEHIRMGCVDVCPFIPLQKTDMQDCIKIAQNTGAKTGGELGIPVYLYGHAAAAQQRAGLAFLREGEYEHLAIKLQNIPPDYGPAAYNPVVKKAGAICIGARNPLVEFSISLATKDTQKADTVAAAARECGPCMPGAARNVRAFAWYRKEYGECQISINLEDYKKTPIYLVYETCAAEAKKQGVKITGSEITGLVPKDLIFDAAKFYLNKQGKIILGMSMAEITKTVADNLGLSSRRFFDMNEKIVELKLKNK